MRLYWDKGNDRMEGPSFFDTFRWYKKAVVLPNEHASRIQSSFLSIFDLNISLKEIKDVLYYAGLKTGCDNTIVRITIFKQNEVFLIRVENRWIEDDLFAPMLINEYRIASQVIPKRKWPKLKTGDWSIYSSEKAKTHEAVLFVNHLNNVTDGLFYNLMGVKKGRVFLFEVDGFGVEGCMFQFLKKHFKLEVKKVLVSELPLLDDIWIINSVRGVQAVKMKSEKCFLDFSQKVKKIVDKDLYVGVN